MESNFVDDFFVDGLLDFSGDCGYVEENDDSQALKHSDEKMDSVSHVRTENEDVSDTGICFPEDDVADLEWVSQFVDDSFSGDYFPEVKPEPAALVTINPLFKSLVHTKARSKRCRTGGRVWSLQSTSPLTDCSTSSSSSSSSTSRKLLARPVLAKPPVQKPKNKKPTAKSTEPVGSGSGPGQAHARRCSHCLVQKTPQWRAGPLGPKTLCNACGVRFKSGRLLPEYRPACSPTFSSDVHSNNHRKVLEMRLKKEAGDGGAFHPVR